MEHARTVRHQWEARAPGWTPIIPVTKEILPGTNDDDLSPLSLIAAYAERAMWLSLMDAWQLVARHVDLKALIHAADRQSELDIDRLLLPDLSATLMRERMVPRFEMMFRHGAEYAHGELRTRPQRKQLDTDLGGAYRAAAIWAREHAGTLITHINERQRDAVRALIAQANSEGISPDEVAVLLRQTIGLRPDQSAAATRFRRRLRDEGVPRAQVRERTQRYQAALQRQRTRMIARTELVTAANAGQMALWQEAIRVGQLPRRPYKRWIVTEDERLCAICESLGAMDPIPIDQEYLPGILTPSAHPNCRCAIALVPDDGGARLMPRGGGIIALRGLGFDGGARIAARNATVLWDAIHELSGASTDPGKFWSDSVVERGVRHVLGAFQGQADLSWINVEVGVPTNNYLGQWQDSTTTLSLNHETTRYLFTLFTMPSGVRDIAQRSENLYTALSTVVHEGLHVLSTMQGDRYRNNREAFLEEGLVEMRARRITAALVVGKLPRKERLKAYRALASATSLQPYERHVMQLRWYERTVIPTVSGSPSLRRLHEDLDPIERQEEIADSLMKYLTLFARQHYTRQEATAIRDVIRGIPTTHMVGALQFGVLPDTTNLTSGTPDMDARTFYTTMRLIKDGALFIP